MSRASPTYPSPRSPRLPQPPSMQATKIAAVASETSFTQPNSRQMIIHLVPEANLQHTTHHQPLRTWRPSRSPHKFILDRQETSPNLTQKNARSEPEGAFTLANHRRPLPLGTNPQNQLPRQPASEQAPSAFSPREVPTNQGEPRFIRRPREENTEDALSAKLFGTPSTGASSDSQNRQRVRWIERRSPLPPLQDSKHPGKPGRPEPPAQRLERTSSFLSLCQDSIRRSELHRTAPPTLRSERTPFLPLHRSETQTPGASSNGHRYLRDESEEQPLMRSELTSPPAGVKHPVDPVGSLRTLQEQRSALP